MMEIQEIDKVNEYGRVYLENEIVHCDFIAERIDLEAAIKCVELRTEFINNAVEYPFCIDARKLKTVTKEARDFFASEKSIQGSKAAAIVFDSVFSCMVANFYLHFNKPQVPVKLFNKMEEAINWLKSNPEFNKITETE
jgi:hypothetical protein